MRIDFQRDTREFIILLPLFLMNEDSVTANERYFIYQNIFIKIQFLEDELAYNSAFDFFLTSTRRQSARFLEK